MRIIGGMLGGRRFHPPAKGWPTRPTTDIAKEALYNILDGKLDYANVRFLDLFGGTGSHSFEMISRGCTAATYVDSYRACCAFVKRTAKELEIDTCIQIVCMDAFRFCRQHNESYDYIFAGPPYGLKGLEEIPDVVFRNDLLSSHGLLVLEHNPHHDFSEHRWFTGQRHYGQTCFSFFRSG